MTTGQLCLLVLCELVKTTVNLEEETSIEKKNCFHQIRLRANLWHTFLINDYGERAHFTVGRAAPHRLTAPGAVKKLNFLKSAATSRVPSGSHSDPFNDGL